MDVDHLFKIVIVGDTGVGKTNLLMRFSIDSFEQNTKNTIGVDFSAMDLQVKGKKVKVQFWDTAGQEKYRSISSAYYKNSHGAIIVYDVSSRPTFDHVPGWLKELKEYGEKNMNVFLVGNKRDLIERREVVTENAEELARSLNLDFVELSAKANEHNEVNNAFVRFVEQIISRVEKDNEQYEAALKREEQISIDKTEKKESKCC